MGKNALSLSVFDLGNWEKELQGNLNSNVCYKEVLGGIPSLQRGLVWKANQIELLWDSILRGFPIGSLTGMEIPEHNPHVKQHVRIHGERLSDKATHYILDGQQRAHAVALAFYDPMEDDKCHDKSKKEQFEKRSYLWIDLGYQKKENQKRSYLFRLVTPSHPWGFSKSGDSTLPHSKIVKHMEGIDTATDQRLYAYQSFPAEATFPVPLAWVIEFAFDNECNHFVSFWNQKKEEFYEHPYFKKYNSITNETIENHTKTIIESIDKLRDYRIAFLLLQTEHIEDMQELFERLNRNGTQVSELELFYSAFKAYFPGIESNIEGVSNELMIHEAYVCVSAFRLLLHKKIGKFIANEPSSKTVISNKLDNNEITDFFENEFIELKNKVLSLVMQSEDDIGLPKAALTYIVKDSRIVLYLLFWIASEKPALFEQCRRALIALIMIIDTFGVKKDLAVKIIISYLSQSKEAVDCDCLKGVVSQLYDLEKGAKGIEKIYSPEELENILVIPDNKEKAKTINSLWDYVLLSVEQRFLEDMQKERERDQLWGFVNRIHNLRHADTILLYAQRKYYYRKFGTYADFSYFWQAHNRPWDYDHILPKSVLYWQKGIEFKSFADPWLWNIGNYRILHFSDNRSRQDSPLGENEKLEDLFLLPKEKNEYNAFLLKTSDFNDFEKAKRFVEASKNRLIEIYRKWWEGLEVDNLL